MLAVDATLLDVCLLFFAIEITSLSTFSILKPNK
nr:MAG TPA: hypothetical protein [Caudoviricetes sp.]